jgi:cell division protein FtsQ
LRVPVGGDVAARSLVRDNRTKGRRSIAGRRAWRRAVRPLLLVASGLAGAAIFASLTEGGRATRQVTPLYEQIDGLLVALGFGINEVWLTGHRYTIDSELFATLDLEKGGSLVRFDPRKARARIEQLAWVETADVTRVFPDRLRIEVRERTPFAVWLHDGRNALVDATGRVLAHVTPGAAPELPRVRGSGAPPAAAELFAALRRHPQIAQRVEVAERIGGRRWTLELEGGSRVHLPAMAQATALERLAELQMRQHVLEQGPVSIDLRLENLIAVRRAGAQVGRSADAPQDASGERG